MPFNFLELSPTYCREAPTGVRQRRDCVASHLDDFYRFPSRAAKQEALQQAQQNQCPTVNDHTIATDASLFYTAFNYLQAPETAKQEIEQKIEAALAAKKKVLFRYRGVYCLMRDKIRTWEEVEGRRPAPEAEATPGAAPPPLETVSGEESIATVPDLQQLVDEANALFQSGVQASASLIATLLDRLNLAQRQCEHLRAQTRLLAEQNQNLLLNLERATEQVGSWEKYAYELDAELKAVATQSLLQLAEKIAHTDRGRQVLLAAQRFSEEQRAEQTRQNLLQGFPEVIASGRLSSHRLVYEQSFIDDLAGRAPQDQERTQDGLTKFSELGSHHPSLQTHLVTDDTIACLPKGCSSSRASDELRFFWKQIGTEVHIYRLGRKGESWLNSSEA